MYNQHQLIMNVSHATFLKITYIFFIISLLILSLGVYGIIEHKSPEYMGSFYTLSASFFAYFNHHILIIFGALCLTLSVWFIRKYSK